MTDLATYWPGTDIVKSMNNGFVSAKVSTPSRGAKGRFATEPVTFEVTPQNVKQLFDYDPLSGVLTRRAYPGGRRTGQPASHIRAGYLIVYVGRRAYLVHRVAWLYMTGSWPEELIDHRDTDTLNNRWANLRPANPRRNSENQRRAHVQSKTGLLGASPYGNRFVACIRAGGKTRHLGYFDTAEAAHVAYVEAKRQLHEGCTL